MGLIATVNSSGEFAKELEAISHAPFIFVGAFIALYTVIVVPGLAIISKETTKTMKARYGGEIAVLKSTLEASEKENKRLETKITDLEKQLPSGTDSSQNLEENKNQSSLKIRAYVIAKRIEQIIEKAELIIGRNTTNLFYNDKTGVLTEVINQNQGSVPYEKSNRQKKIQIIREAIEEYDSEVHNIALGIRQELVCLSKNSLLTLENYSYPKSLQELEGISNNLRTLADGLTD